MNAESKKVEFGTELYYADVEAEMKERLQRPENANVDHAFFWGHGKSTMALFKKLTGANEAFNPTAGMMVVAIKTKDWDSFFNAEHSEVKMFAWSPRETHQIDGLDDNVNGLEGVQLESAFESLDESLESVRAADPIEELSLIHI